MSSASFRIHLTLPGALNRGCAPQQFLLPEGRALGGDAVVKSFSNGEREVSGAIYDNLVFLSWRHAIVGLLTPLRRLPSHTAVASSTHDHYGNVDVVPRMLIESFFTRSLRRHRHNCFHS